jgi:hypothetical protein
MLFTDHVTLTSFQIDSIEAIEKGRWGSSFRCRRFIIISASQAMPCSLLRHPSDQPPVNIADLGTMSLPGFSRSSI